MRVNVDGLANVYSAVRAAKVKRLVFASSCAVYGDTENLPISEDAEPRPLSPYAVSKLEGEHFLAKHSGEDLSMVSLRFFNIFGPWQDHRGGYAAVIPQWIHILRNGERPTLFGDGTSSRDFCFVNDLCNVIEHFGQQSSADHRIFNVGTGRGTNLLQLLDVIHAELRRLGLPCPPAEPNILPFRSGDIRHSRADIERLAATLGFRPVTDLATGISTILQEELGLRPAAVEDAVLRSRDVPQ
jgi:nucleoside-diphosphate-sugar epimerase